ncbi:radical SAM protein, partial [bacterium]|nr:radical SAM protein [bacterium]
FNNWFNKNKFKKVTQVNWVTGGCMLISREVFSRVRGFDENYFFGVEDIDFCYQVKKNGHKIIYCPLSEVIHYHGQSSGGRRSVFKLNYEKKGINYFFKKNFPNRKLSMKLVDLFYKIKINLIKQIENRKLNKIKDAVLAVTYICNARCERCHIWKNTDRSQIKAEDLKNLPKNLKDINISGGEPFLLPDLVDLIKTIKEKAPKASIVISTNGFATDLIEKQIKDILKIDKEIGVAVSLDGGAEIHDKLRGIPGGYEKLMKSIKVLKENNLKNLKISFTLGDENIRELKKIYNLSHELGAEFSLTSVHSGDNYFGTQSKINLIDKIEEELNWLIKKELKSFNPKRWGRAYYTYGLREYIKTGRRILPDYSGKYNIFVDPKKDIYACDVSNKKMGSIINSEFVLNDEEKDNECSKSWMICTARPAIKKHWIRAGFWLLKNKFLSL